MGKRALHLSTQLNLNALQVLPISILEIKRGLSVW